MTRAQDVDTLVLARRGLLAACVLTIAGAAFALVFGVPQGTVAGTEIWLNASSITFSTGVLVALAVLPLARLPGIALTAPIDTLRRTIARLNQKAKLRGFSSSPRV